MFKLMFFLVCAAALAPKSHAQAAADPGWGLIFIDCNGNVISINGNSETGTYCTDNFGPGTFGSAETTVSGECEVSFLDIGPVSASASWANCTAPLVGDTDGGVDVHVAVDPDFCDDVNAALVWANASVFNYFLGTLVAQGQRGWWDCTDNNTPAVPPVISSC
jgi:hypothetical protein